MATYQPQNVKLQRQPMTPNEQQLRQTIDPLPAPVDRPFSDQDLNEVMGWHKLGKTAPSYRLMATHSRCHAPGRSVHDWTITILDLFLLWHLQALFRGQMTLLPDSSGVFAFIFARCWVWLLLVVYLRIKERKKCGLGAAHGGVGAGHGFIWIVWAMMGDVL